MIIPNFHLLRQWLKCYLEPPLLEMKGRGRCLCVTAGAPSIHPKYIAKVEIYGQSSSCQQIEVIGSGQRKCLNSKSKQASRLIRVSHKDAASVLAFSMQVVGNSTLGFEEIFYFSLY
uniref:Chemokine interleukin-8-like domain-containing protein n=1 Tax=Terrapene triunguis TaxID=2587831 RepID=A0A674IBT6_9SAUR